MTATRPCAPFLSALAAGLCLGSPPVTAGAAAPAGPLDPLGPRFAPSAPVAAQTRLDEFQKLWAQASKINAKEEMEKLVRQYNDEAILRVIAILELISAQQANDALFKELGELRSAWQSTIKSNFVDEVEKYFSLLHASARAERDKYVRSYRIASGDLANAKNARDVNKIRSLSARFEELAGQFESIGDYYYAGQCWANAVAANHPDNVGVDVEYNKLADLLGEFVRTREKIDLKDALYGQNKASYSQLSGQGFGKNAAKVAPTGGAGGGGGEAGAAASDIIPRGTLPAGDPIESTLQFQLIEDPTAVERPNYNADEVYHAWMGLGFLKKGTTADFARVKDGPRVHRTGSRELEIDVDQDGTPELLIPVTGNIETVQFEVGKGDERRPWAILTTVGNQNDFYQGIAANLAPTDENALVYYMTASSVVGEIAGVPVQIFDEDVDAFYGSPSKVWAWMGLTPGAVQPEMDSIAIGKKADRAVPWSEFLQIEDVWYKLEPTDFGRKIKATPYDLPTGRLKLKFSGPKPAWLIMKGTGRYQNCMFDLVGAGSKGIEVPVGTYQLYYGEVRKGSKLQVSKTVILPGKDTQTWEVKEDETVTVELGKPFGFDFEIQQSDTEVVVLGNTVSVIGKAGERYERPWNCVPRPDVSIRKAGTRKGTKPEQMNAMVGTDQLFNEGYEWAWTPLNTTFKKSGGADTVEVQLTEKKNKLFGKVESEWKQ